MTVDENIARLAALANPHRFRIIAMLSGEPLHVSELARRLGMSRALLYMHLQRLEAAGFVSGRLELSDDGRALKFFEVLPFQITTDVASIVAAVAADPAPDTASDTAADTESTH